MTSPYITAAFEEKFNRDLHLAFQQQGTLFRACVRTDGDVQGKSVHFQKLGKLQMVAKTRYGDIPMTNPDHARVTAVMEDRYLFVVEEQLDLAKIGINLRNGHIASMVGAANRTIDEMIIEAMDTSTQTLGDHGTSDPAYITETFALRIGEALDRKDVPRDGKRYVAVTPRQWAALMKIPSYANGQYVGPDLPFKKIGHQMRTWNDLHWFESNLLPGVGTNQTRCFAWHMSAVGLGINQDYKVVWSWDARKHANVGSASLALGACVIDNDGLIEVRLDDTAALPA